jgi:hypothetical protein
MSEELIKVCGLYKKKDKDGNKYLTGSIPGTEIRINIFPNKLKKEDIHPDYQLVIRKNK